MIKLVTSSPPFVGGEDVTNRFALEEYEEAFRTSLERKGGAIKVVFEM